MTTWKGWFDRLEGLAMGDRRARTTDAVLNVVTAAGLVSLPHHKRARLARADPD